MHQQMHFIAKKCNVIELILSEQKKQQSLFRFYKHLNMRNSVLLLFLTCSLTFSNTTTFGQIISHFTWDNPPVYVADVGPNAISYSSSAIVDVNGANGTNGLNPSLPKRDLFFTLPDSNIFNVDGIDIQIDFQRDESVGSLVSRGTTFDLKGLNQLSVTYTVEDGSGGTITVSSGNVYPMPNDDTFRTYRFIYVYETGIGMLMVDGDIKWSNDGVDKRAMVWNNANIVIGKALDGNGSNKTSLDNLIIRQSQHSPLPVELVNFDAAIDVDDQKVHLDWSTASELNNNFFMVERSSDLQAWEAIAKINGVGTTANLTKYGSVDVAPLIGTSYYRLKQVDFDGTTAYSPVESVENTHSTLDIQLNVYPNPASDYIVISGLSEEVGQVFLLNTAGQVVLRSNHEVTNSTRINISDLDPGMYFVVYQVNQFRETKRVIVN